MATFNVNRQPAVKLAKGTKAELAKTPLTDGLLSVTTDDSRIHIDYNDENGQVVRKTLYSGKLTIGQHVYDGTKDVAVDVATTEETLNYLSITVPDLATEEF